MSGYVRVLVDGRAVRQQCSGVGRPVKAIMSCLRSDRRFEFAVITGVPEVWGDGGDVRFVQAGRPGESWPQTKRLVWEQWRLRRVLRAEKPHVYWATWNYGVPWRCRTPSVVTIHDVIPRRHKGHFGSRLYGMCYRMNLYLATKWASRIVVPSQATKAELVRDCGVGADRISVVTHGIAGRFSPVASGSRDLERDGRTVLYVGSSEPRKNVDRLFTACDELADRRNVGEFSLALTARRESLAPAARSAYERMQHKDVVRFLGYVSDDDLPGLYRKADLFVFPSSEEGFGFPPLEAMASGVPVICGRYDSLPEVVGDAAMIVDVTDTKAVVHGMESVLMNEGLARAMRRRGLARAAGFTWAGAAEAMAGILMETAVAT